MRANAWRGVRPTTPGRVWLVAPGRVWLLASGRGARQTPCGARARTRATASLTTLSLLLAIASPAAFGATPRLPQPASERVAQGGATVPGTNIPIPTTSSTTPNSATPSATTPNSATTPANTTPSTTTPGAATPGAATPSTNPTVPPSTTTPGATATAKPGAQPARAKRTARHRTLSTGALAGAIAAVVVLLLCALWAAMRWLAVEPSWTRSVNLSLREASFHASATWAEFLDWARLGR